MRSGALSTTQLAELRTYLAAERTLFAILRTGLSIAAGGSLVITLLGDDWPKWVQAPLVAAFLIAGYSMALLGLRRYRSIVERAEQTRGTSLDMLSSRAMWMLTISLQVAITVVVVLFLVGAFESPG